MYSMYAILDLKKRVKEELIHALQSLDFPEPVRLETPSSTEFGDIAFPCFSLCKISKKSPQDTAKQIAEKLSLPPGIEKCDVQGGYLNFWFDAKHILKDSLSTILTTNEKYGILEKKQKKVIVEHTSANPNGPLHIGRARNPIIGDTIARLMTAAGYIVESQFYLDDLGKQVAILTWAVHHLTEEDVSANTRDKPDHHAVRFYQKAYDLMKENDQITNDIDTLVHQSELGDEQAIALGKKAYEPVLAGISESLAHINITIDNFIPESKFVKDGSVNTVIEELKNTSYCENEDGALFLDVAAFGVKGRSTKFYLTRSNGTSLYATRDIAYHRWKSEHADMLVNVLGEDHKLESRQVEIALDLLDVKPKPVPVFYAFVSLPGGKMSTRRGRVVYLDDLIEETKTRALEEVKKRRGSELDDETMEKIAETVGIGALRYNIIKVQPEKDIEFKWEEALSFDGNTAPFVQYAIARCASIQRKGTVQSETLIDKIDATVLTHDSEIRLGKQLAQFPVVIDEAAHSFKPHLITQFLFETASLFNQFYRDCPVLSAEKEVLKLARLGLVRSTQIVLKNGLQLLGIDALEEM